MLGKVQRCPIGWSKNEVDMTPPINPIKYLSYALSYTHILSHTYSHIPTPTHLFIHLSHTLVTQRSVV